MVTFQLLDDSPKREPWNKRPLKLKEIWPIRIRLQMEGNVRDLALLNLAIDSKLRGCDLVRLRVADVTHSGKVMSRANVMQRKTCQPVKFEITEETQDSISDWIAYANLSSSGYLFPSRIRTSPQISTRQYRTEI